MKENENFWKHEKYTMQKKDTGRVTRGSVKNIYIFTNMRWAGGGVSVPIVL